jgi:hypothetical protein
VSIDTARLRALKAAATPGPWTLEQYEHNSEELCGVQVSSAAGVLFDSLNAEWTMGCRMPPEDSESKWSETGQHVNNLKLAVEAVNALPGLLDEVERLRAHKARMESDDHHVAWLKYKQHPNGYATIHIAASDERGAFKVHRWPDSRLDARERDIAALERELDARHRDITLWSKECARLRTALEQIANRSELDAVLMRNEPQKIAKAALNPKEATDAAADQSRAY